MHNNMYNNLLVWWHVGSASDSEVVRLYNADLCILFLLRLLFWLLQLDLLKVLYLLKSTFVHHLHVVCVPNSYLSLDCIPMQFQSVL